MSCALFSKIGLVVISLEIQLQWNKILLDLRDACSALCVQSSGKLEMERGMVKPMIRGEQQDSRSVTNLLFCSCFFSSVFFVLLVFILLVFILLSVLGVIFLLLTVLFLSFRSQDISADRTELTLPAGIEFRDNCKLLACLALSLPLAVIQSITGNYWTLLVALLYCFRLMIRLSWLHLQ